MSDTTRTRTPRYCPECGNALVFDGGLWHCDNPDGSERHGAFDRENTLTAADLDPVDTLGTYNDPRVLHGPNADGEYPCSGLATACLCEHPTV